MSDPAAQQLVASLDSQLADLTRALARLRFLAQYSVPGEPGPEWRGAARWAYTARLGELAETCAEGIRETETACAETRRAIATMAGRV